MDKVEYGDAVINLINMLIELRQHLDSMIDYCERIILPQIERNDKQGVKGAGD